MQTPLEADPVGRTPASRTSFRALWGAVDRRFLLLDAAVRLPTAMLPLGILLYVADRTGSYGTGGLAVAALSIGGGAGGSLVGLAADRFGQRLVGLVVTLVQAAALLAFLVLAPGDVLPLTLGLAGLIGLANPQAGAMARSRWAAVARRRGDGRSFTSTAMAWEGTLDEVSFVVGPVLVSVVAALAQPAVGLALALAVAATSQVGFALHPTSLPGRHGERRDRPHDSTPLPALRIGALLLAMGAVGLVFGATQTGVAARMASAGTDELTGPVYAVLGVGSALAGLLTTRLPHSLRLEARILGSGALIALGGIAGWAAGGVVLLAASCLLIGVAVAPAMISAYALAEQLAPDGWATTMMTGLGTANVVGVAAGAATAGLLVDRVSPGSALLVDVVAGGLVLVAGAIALLSGSRVSGSRPPGPRSRLSSPPASA